MTPKEKAKELFIKFYTVELFNGTHLDKEAAKECALIAVDEILKEYNIQLHQLGLKTIVEYWQQVKQEINKL